jgi:hypothetical protein
VNTGTAHIFINESQVEEDYQMKALMFLAVSGMMLAGSIASAQTVSSECVRAAATTVAGAAVLVTGVAATTSGAGTGIGIAAIAVGAATTATGANGMAIHCTSDDDE